MPMLFYGWHEGDLAKRMYSPKHERIKSKVFDMFREDGLAPDEKTPNLTLLWHIKKHTAISWWDDQLREQTVFLPGTYLEIDALAVARESFGDLIPPAIVFRICNEGEVYEA